MNFSDELKVKKGNCIVTHFSNRFNDEINAVYEKRKKLESSARYRLFKTVNTQKRSIFKFKILSLAVNEL